jgi:Acetyltransferase (GNAT) domain
MKLDATPQGKILYQKLGFANEYEIERWMLKRHPKKKEVGRPTVDIEDVLRLDRDIFGADRSLLLRSIAKEALEFTLKAGPAGGIAGYTFGRRGTRADHLGPWMASSRDTAAVLLDQFLAVSDRELVVADCVRDNPWAVPLVKARGFEFSRPLTPMYRGTNLYPGRPEMLCAILGPEFG